MNLTQLLSSPQGKQVIEQLAGQLNMDTTQAAEAAKQLMPAIQTGMRTRIQQDPSALSQILGGKEQEVQGYVQQGAAAADTAQMTSTGNAILGQIFGSKDVSREVANRAATNTGLELGAVKAMLPMLASLAGGQLASAAGNQGQASGGGLLGNLLGGLMGGKKSGGAANSALTALLDQDGDGSIADDLMGMASKFLK
ncbi:MAG: DUF937 domain-containing protein [Alphaproteobacteria bacterium]